MNEQLILAIINFYEEHIQQLNNKNHIQFQKYADKENVNQMAYSELEKMNDDLAKANAESQAIGDRDYQEIRLRKLEIKNLRKEIDQLKKENRKVKKITKKEKRKK